MWERIDGSPEEPSWWSEDIAESIDRAGAPLLAMENLQPAVTVCDGELDPNTRLICCKRMERKYSGTLQFNTSIIRHSQRQLQYIKLYRLYLYIV